MILREEARLRALFQRLLVLSVAATPAACSTSGGNDAGVPPADATQPSGDDASQPSGQDASQPSGQEAGTPDAGAPTMDATVDSGTDPYGYADSSCDPVYLDGAGDGGVCQFYQGLPCNLPPDAASEGCFLTFQECGILCNQPITLSRVCAVTECLSAAAEAGVDASGNGATIPQHGPLTLECATGLFACGTGIGRRPDGLVDCLPARRGDAIGSSLAEAARLEAASVYAFRRFGSELAAMRAPRALVRAAERAARDEVRHARVTARLARRRGAAPGPVVVERNRHPRSIEAFAIENAVEGCVRECFGALVATRQAAFARDPQLAQEMVRIARDETRHAALAWQVARWLTPRLRADSRRRVRDAMVDAIATLRREVATTPPEVATELGLPTGSEGVALVDAFAASLLA
jgi:hypothetical protein